MSGKLTDKFMDQLEQWIGTGPKTFDLLYSITKNGCNSTVFHQKCDNQGPTVTVLYNQQGSVYGGYTGINWDQSGTWGDDSTAFLFQLQYNGSATVNKFPCKNSAYTTYRASNCGPVFGKGNDLLTFTGTVNNSGGYYALNGSGMSGLGHSYNNQGITANQINNGTMNVTELEVYQVKSK